MKLKFYLDQTYKGLGISQGLARGVQVSFDGQNLVQEGMGLGAIALRSGGLTYFASTSHVSTSNKHTMASQFVIDTAALSGRNGSPAPWWTCLREKASSLCAKIPLQQDSILSTGLAIRRLFGVETIYKTIKPRAEAKVQYSVNDSSVQIECQVRLLKSSETQVFIMNELGADYFKAAWQNGSVTKPSLAWEELEPGVPLPSLCYPAGNLCFTIQGVTVSNEVPCKIYWGREKTSEHCWAGFAIMLDFSGTPKVEATCRYQVNFNRNKGIWRDYIWKNV